MQHIGNMKYYSSGTCWSVLDPFSRWPVFASVLLVSVCWSGVHDSVLGWSGEVSGAPALD